MLEEWSNSFKEQSVTIMKHSEMIENLTEKNKVRIEFKSSTTCLVLNSSVCKYC